jgi:dephospho-CoA kinase
MYQVGVTGGIGSGKTLVCSVLEKLGIPVYYADRAARGLMNSDQRLMEEVVALLGKEAYRNGSLDREYTAAQVFGNPEKLTALNSLVHPAVRRDYTGWLEQQQDAPYVVEEAAILFESGARRFLDLTVLVYAPEALRIQRVMERDGVEEEEVRKRMVHQMDEEKKRAMADLVIVNDGQDLLLPEIIQVHRNIMNRI